jgi:hypothetical protein
VTVHPQIYRPEGPSRDPSVPLYHNNRFFTKGNFSCVYGPMGIHGIYHDCTESNDFDFDNGTQER